MNMLGKTETTPVRKFISFKDNDACNVLDNLLLKVGERDLKIQGGLTDQEREKYGLDADQGEHDEATADALRGRKIAKAAKDKRLKGLNAQVKGYKFEDGKTVIEVPLGEAKMNAAKGKRPGELTQAAVMGNVSASDIAGPLGWQTTRLASGFFSSEWLHLAAFSWGGFESATAKSGFSTSQNLENLVFGSSETNSLMTRYEMAWQDFYRTEQKLHDHLAAVLEEAQRPVYGRLSIRCNDFSKEICYDFFNDKTKKYDFKYFTMNPAMVEEVKEGAAKNLDSPSPNTMRALYNGERDRSERFYQNLRTNKQEFTTEAEMLFIAHDFPLVVYSIQYTIENGFTSILFNDQAPATFSFYPFQRSLYHQAEAVLDALVWRKIKKAAYAFVGVADELDDVDELEEFREVSETSLRTSNRGHTTTLP
ncbi:hypothetical protein B0T25DRAFT_454621 [Lasiosphaeria hispida]|uniref:Uncharacterized protein n=1 Tax=Lasiosphaeria hispida TaxID=260671 RepID=A0AAJ0HH02_9PEZI|nr:hypothetical protein B0T25DRAFT_454621 [Lasiosphaeria hispida]